MMKTCAKLAALCVLGGSLFLSCQSMIKQLAEAVEVSAQAAGDAGLIRLEIAQSIVKTSRAVGTAAEEITPEQAYYIGRAVGANILTRYKLDASDPALAGYLNRIAGAIAVNSPLRSELNSAPHMEPYNGYHVAILDSQEINAFATSGGHIFVSRGLLSCARSEDALAAVLAHEIAHIQLLHGIEAIKQDRWNQVAKSVTEGTVFRDSVTDIVDTMYSGYSQDQEFNADALALVLLASAGYEPSSLIDMLKVLEQTQAGHPGGFNATHPSPAARISNANARIGPLQVDDTRSYRRPRFDAAIASGR